MSYTNPTGNSSATINETAQDLYIFNSVTDVQYDPDPYAKILTMSGGAAVTYTNVTISSGGTADVAKSTLMRNVTVSSGGSMIYREGANFKDLTVESGGWASNIGNSIVFSNFVIKSGATVALTNAKLYGRNNSVAAGTLAGNVRADSDSVNGVICGYRQLGGAFNYYDIVFSNFTNNGGYTYMNNGVEILNGSAIKAGAGFAFNGSVYIKNLNVTNGYVWTHLAGAAVSLGGAETTIAKGHWYHNTCAGTGTPDNDLYASGGVLYGVTLKTAGNWIRNLTILDGLTISAPAVNSGGKLFIGSGGSGAAITVNNAGSAVVLSNGSATGLTVNNGGSAIVSSGGQVATTVVENGGKVSLATGAVLSEAVTVSDGGKLNYDGAGLYNLVVKAGGSASAGTNGAGYHGVTVEAGGYLRMRTANIYDSFDVAPNTLAGFLTSPDGTVDGVFCGGSHNTGALHYFGNIAMSNYHVTGAAYTYIAQGVSIRDAYAEVAGGGFAFEGAGYIYNARVTNGSMWMHNQGANISLGGAETYIEKGHFYQNNCAGTGTPDPNLYASGGVLYDVLIKNNGYNWLRKLTVLEGLTISGAVMSSGGSLTLGAGGSGNDLTVSGYGRLYVSNGGIATNAHGKGAMYAYDGGIITSATVESTGAMHVSSGGVANDIAVDSGAKLYVSSGATVNRLTVSVGGLNATNMHAVFHNGAAGNDISIYGDKNSNQYNVSAYGNAVLSNVYQSGGGLWVYENATVKDLTVEKGEMVFQDNTYGSNVTVSGGTAILYVRNNALVENLRMSSAEARFNAGTVRNAVFVGAIGQLKASTGFLIESASADSGAVISAVSGGSINSLTVGNNAQLQVHNGGEVTNLVLNGGANGNRIRLYDGGHISGATISGTDGTRNYVSALTGSGLIEDVTTEKAGIYLASGGIIRNVTLRNSASVILRGEHPYASGAYVSGGYLYFQNGAKGENVVVSGGNLYVHDDGYAGEVIGSGAKVSGVDLLKGEIKVSAGGKLFDLRASGGSVTVKSTGTTYGDPLLSGAVFTGGVLTLSGGAVAKNIKLDGGGAIYGENATLEDFDIEAPDVKGKKLAISGAAMIASGGRINGSSNVGIMDMTGGATFNEAYVSGGSVFLSGLATITNVELTGGAVILRGEESYVSGATVLGGTLHIQNGGKGDDITIAGGSLSVTDTNMTNPAGSSEIVNDVTMTAGAITIGSGGTVNNLNATGGTIKVSSAAVLNVAATDVLNNINTYAGAHVNFVEHATGVMLQGSNTNIAANTFYYAGATQALGFTVTNGVVENLGADGKAYRLSVGDEIVVNDAIVTDNCRVSGFAGAVLNRLSISGKTAAASVVLKDNARSYDAVLTGSNGKTTLLAISGSVIAYDTTVNSGGTLRFNGPTAYASGTVVNSGGKIEYNTGMGGFGHIEDTTLKAGATLTLSDGADTGDKLTLDFTGTTGNKSVTINNLGYVADTTAIVLVGETAGNTYTIATTGATDKYVNCGEWGLYDDSVKAGESITNAFTGMSYEFNADGTAIAVSEFTAATQATAGSIAGGTTIGDNGKAAKWTQNTTAEAGATYHAATGDISNEAWLEIDGTNLGGTTLFGADASYNGAVNLYATGDAVIGNLAAGATSSGTVAGVKLTVDGATVGLAYAGGFGTVANAAETLIEEGTFQKDFYAGALANYAKTGHATQVGSVSLTITGGEFSGNIYGASAVKAGAATSLVHSVGDVTITVKDGESKKGNQACLFAGGYATGTAASENAVYTVNNIDVTIDGGNWGAVAGGRGVFGGIFASKVTAAAQDVSISINGGTFGNVYGGGWSQQGGASIVGDVYINITGGTIANVFGGGTHSTSGGSTTVGDVTINVSGGDITGKIYVGGQQTGDSTGAASVNFTSDSNFACGVYGYSYGGGTTGDAALNFTAYTGTFSGAIGGFAGITLDDDTAMTLGTAAEDVNNTAWTFDFTDRADTLAGTSFLTWDSADFAGDTVRVNFANATQAAAGWNIATADFTGATFDLCINGATITTVAYNTAISGGDWNGWGFTLDSGVLKFKQLA